ncbi:hypothetical protein V8F33_013141 [Rhypophila sp. PSN 637]
MVPPMVVDASSSSNLLSDQPAPTVTFHLFSALCAELQMMVWEFVPSVPRWFCVQPGVIHPLSNRYRAPHVLLHICRLSRKIALNRMILTQCLTWRKPFSVPVYIDMVYDVFDISYIDPGMEHAFSRFWGFSSTPETPVLVASQKGYGWPPSVQEMKLSMSGLERNLARVGLPTLAVRNISFHVHVPRFEFSNLSTETMNAIKHDMKKLFPAADNNILMSDHGCVPYYILAMSPECQEITIRPARPNHEGVYNLVL